MEKTYIHEIHESVDEKCWKLSTYLLAQYDIKEMSHPYQEYWCIFENQFQASFDKHFFKELIEIAALLRTLLDINEIKIEKEFAGISTQVGKLTDGKNSNELFFREACNKIVHSKKHSIKLLFDDKHPLCNGKNGYEKSDVKIFKAPIIVTGGRFHDGGSWVAEIDFFKFIDQAMNLNLGG